jgi:hypothetical protein
VDIKELVAQVKSIKSDEKEELYRVLFEDEELLENLLDYAAMLQAEAEGGEPDLWFISLIKFNFFPPLRRKWTNFPNEFMRVPSHSSNNSPAIHDRLDAES